jgi:predicted AlkP superfamily phosphohydrolase/phosphomutase
MSESNKRRVLILGIDGATFDVMDPLIAAGRLPNFARLMRSGTSAPLRSTQPCQSSVAWPALMSGKNPGKTGVFAFWVSNPGQVLRPLISYKNIKTTTMWETLSDRGYRVGSVNLPVSFPPPKVNGTMVAGLLTPSQEAALTYPPRLHAELMAQVGRIPIEMELMQYSGSARELEFLNAAIHAMRMRTRVSQYLIERDPEWDVFMTTWTITDRVQHFFWKYMDPEHPASKTERGAKMRDVIPQVYEAVDREVGKMLEYVDLERDTVLLASDHGFGPKRKNVYLNRWLEQEGLFHYQSPYELRRWRLMPRPVSLGGGLRRLGLRHPITERLRRLRVPLMKPVSLPPFMLVDWSKTKAYNNFIGSEEGIFVNLKGREPDGIVEPGTEYEAVRDEIIEKLHTLVDPEDGLPVVDSVVRREEIYSGPHVDAAPDLIVTMREHSYMPGVTLRTKEIFRSTSDPRIDSGEQESESGQHRDYGIFIMAGRECVGSGERFGDAEIIDVYPTLLYLLDEAIPDDVDGKVLRPAIQPGILQAREIRASAAEGPKESDGGAAYSEEEDELVKERLKSLGYFG